MKGEWYMDLEETMLFLTPVSYLSLKVYNTMFFQLDLKKYSHIEPHLQKFAIATCLASFQ